MQVHYAYMILTTMLLLQVLPSISIAACFSLLAYYSCILQKVRWNLEMISFLSRMMFLEWLHHARWSLSSSLFNYLACLTKKKYISLPIFHTDYIFPQQALRMVPYNCITGHTPLVCLTIVQSVWLPLIAAYGCSPLLQANKWSPVLCWKVVQQMGVTVLPTCMLPWTGLHVTAVSMNRPQLSLH